MPPKTPVKVVHLVLSLGRGGMENGIVNVTNRLKSEDISTHIICIRRRGAMAERLTSATNVDCLDYETGFSMVGVWKLVNKLRALQPDIVYTHNCAALIWGGLACQLYRKPIWIHGEHGSATLYNTVPCKLIRRCACVTAVSDNLIEEIRRCYKWPEANVNVIRNGVDTDLFKPLEEHSPPAPACLPDTGEAPRYAIVGRLEDRKNHELAFDALHVVANELTDTPERIPHLLMFGEGIKEKALQKQADKLGISMYIHFLGFRDDLNQLLPYLDALLLPSSRGEGMANVLLEAASCSLPVLASDITGNDIIVNHEKTGFLLPLDDPQPWADKMRELALSPSTRRQIGPEGRKWVLANFSIKRMVEDYRDLYLSLANR